MIRTPQEEIGIKIVQDLATKAKKYLLRTLDGELLKRPTDELMKELDQNYDDFIQYLKHIQYTLFVVFGLNVNIGFGEATIDLDKEQGENNE